jgi:drug/metabolite transporter (DMT)-like permease
MNFIDVAAALLSALLHASWNAAVKNSRTPAQAMTAQMLLSALICVPGLIWSGLPPLAAWPWVAASTAVNVVAIMALLRAYELGGFGIVYPVARAIGVLLVVPLAALVAGDRVGTYALIGIAIMALALGAIAWDAARSQSASRAALLWIFASGVGIAAYVMCDAQGVRATGSAWSYGFAVSITNAAAMCWRNRALGSPLKHISTQWKVGVPCAIASTISYLLILWVWTHAPIAPAAALRDTSAIFAILIAIVFLREPFTRTRIAAVVLAAAAIPLLRLG